MRRAHTHAYTHLPDDTDKCALLAVDDEQRTADGAAQHATSTQRNEARSAYARLDCYDAVGQLFNDVFVARLLNCETNSSSSMKKKETEKIIMRRIESIKFAACATHVTVPMSLSVLHIVSPVRLAMRNASLDGGAT